MVNPEYRAAQAEDEISSADVIRFFSRNAKFIGLVTIGLSAIAIALSLLTPKQYQKQLSVSVKFIPVSLSVGSFAGLDISQTSALAVEFLRSSKLDKITAKAQSNPETQEINVNLQSPNASSLNSAVPKVINQLKTKFQEPVGQSLEANLMTTKQQLEKQQRILPQLDQQIAKLPISNTPKLQALESQRAKTFAHIAALEFDKDYLEQGQKNLSEITAKIMSVKVLSQSEVEPVSSTKQLVVIAAIASFMVAVITAIVREQVPRLKNELSQQTIERSTDV